MNFIKKLMKIEVLLTIITGALLILFIDYYGRTKKQIYLFLSIILIWSLKNIINTGCIIYPVHQLCFEVLSWSDIEKTKYSNIAGEAASKGYLDKIKILKENNYLTDKNDEITEYQKFNQNFNWKSNHHS